MSNIPIKQFHEQNKLPKRYSVYGNMKTCLLYEDDHSEILYHISSRESSNYTYKVFYLFIIIYLYIYIIVALDYTWIMFSFTQGGTFLPVPPCVT